MARKSGRTPEKRCVFFHSPQHHGLLNAVTFEGLNDLPELPDTNPMQPIDHLLQLRSRFALMSHGRYSKPQFFWRFRQR